MLRIRVEPRLEYVEDEKYKSFIRKDSNHKAPNVLSSTQILPQLKSI